MVTADFKSSFSFLRNCSYKNGSKTRELIRDTCAGEKWEEFDRLLDLTEPGNHGNIGMLGAAAIL